MVLQSLIRPSQLALLQIGPKMVWDTGSFNNTAPATQLHLSVALLVGKLPLLAVDLHPKQNLDMHQ